MFKKIITEHYYAYLDYDKTIVVIKRNFNISNLGSIIKDIDKVYNCYQQTKYKKHKHYKLFYSLD